MAPDAADLPQRVISESVEHEAVGSQLEALAAHELTLSEDYNAPALEEFLGAIAADASPRTPQNLLSPIAMLSAITASLERNS